VDHRDLYALAKCVLASKGVPDEDAHTTADCLVRADLRGVGTHGVIRLKVYADRLQAGGNNPRPDIRVVKETATAAVLDGDRSLGPVGGRKAMELAIEKAREAGVGMVAIRNSNHYGAAAYYAMMALEHDMIGHSMTNVLASMPPTGGREAKVGNNPFALALPAGEEPPVVLDAATSRSSWGKIFAAAQTGERLPEDCFLDKEGKPTTDAHRALEAGLLLPIAEHKGYGMALCIAVLTGLLADAEFDIDLPHPYKMPDEPGYNSFFQAAVRVDQFVPVAHFKTRMDGVVRQMRSAAPAPGVEGIYLPGEKEHVTELERIENGIPLNEAMLRELEELARESGVEFKL